jgi:hypothetical protein
MNPSQPGRPQQPPRQGPAAAAPAFADTGPRTRPPSQRGNSTFGERTMPPRAVEAAAPSWCLRFLGGALRGRTMALKPGANVLGSAAECEVLLPGSDVMPRHLVLTVGELVVSLQKVGAASVLLNGEDMKQPRKSVVAGDVVAIGRIEFQLDQVYPQQEQDDPMFAGPPSVLPDDSMLPGMQAPRPRRTTSFWAGAGAAVLALAGLAAVAVWSQRAAEVTDGDTINLAEVEKVLAGFPETEVIALPGGQFNVKGYVETRQRRQILRDAMARFGRRVSVNVHSAEDMVEQARRYVSDPAIAISYTGQGRLVISGTVDDETVRGKLRRLSEDLHPTVLVSDKVQYVPRPPKPQVRDTVDEREQALSWQRLLPSPVVSITEDEETGMHHIQLANGSRYYEGAVLRSGAQLTRIKPDGVTVRGGSPPPPR